jgi:hypothetical protein
LYEPTLLSKYASRDAWVYYALVLPAVILQVVFSVAIASTPGDLVAQGAPDAGVVSVVVRFLPWILLVVSGWAVFSFRTSILVTLLVASFFVAVSVANVTPFLGASLDSGTTVILVIAAAFLALVGFSYARGIVLLDGRRPETSSSGPLSYNLLGTALDVGVPILAALALVLIVEAAVVALNVQAARLPQPLSTLASLYLQTRIGVVFTTLFVAGATIWVLRQFIEPVILHFTLSPKDARRELLSEIEPTTRSIRRIARYPPSRGLSWAFLTIAYCAGLLVALAVFMPRGQLLHDLGAILSLHAPSPSPLEQRLQNSFQNSITWVDIHYAQSQDFLRSIIRVLWG